MWQASCKSARGKSKRQARNQSAPRSDIQMQEVPPDLGILTVKMSTKCQRSQDLRATSMTNQHCEVLPATSKYCQRCKSYQSSLQVSNRQFNLVDKWNDGIMTSSASLWGIMTSGSSYTIITTKCQSNRWRSRSNIVGGTWGVRHSEDDGFDYSLSWLRTSSYLPVSIQPV